MKMKTQECLLSIVGASAITMAIAYLVGFIAPNFLAQCVAALQFVAPDAIVIDLSIKNYIMGVVGLAGYILVFVHAFYYIYGAKKK
jgi:hypothetical protein